MRETARRAFVASLVVGAVVVAGLALWKLRILLALLFAGFTIAAAMRPGIEALRRRGVARGIGLTLHYLGLFAFVTLLLWLVVPRVLAEIQLAVGDLPRTRTELETAARETSGIWQAILSTVQRWLGRLPTFEQLPSPGEVVTSLLQLTVTAFEIALGTLFTLATAAYWIFERDRAQELVLSVVPGEKRRVVRDTWNLVDLKLGAYVRGQLLLILWVGTVLSAIFWLIGLPYWILIGAFAGVIEIIPVIGPWTAGALAVAVGLTVSWKVAVAAGVAVFVVRLVEDYVVIPRVLGHAVGLSSLFVLVSVAAVAILFGGFAVLLAIPLAAMLATLADVLVRHRDPSKEDVPAVLFPAKETARDTKG